MVAIDRLDRMRTFYGLVMASVPARTPEAGMGSYCRASVVHANGTPFEGSSRQAHAIVVQHHVSGESARTVSFGRLYVDYRQAERDPGRKQKPSKFHIEVSSHQH